MLQNRQLATFRLQRSTCMLRKHEVRTRATAACENRLNISTPSTLHLYWLTRSKQNTWQQHVSLARTQPAARGREKNTTKGPRARHASGYIAYACFQEGLLHFIFHRFFARSVASVSQGRPQTRDFIPDKCITSCRKEWTHCSLMRFKWTQVFWSRLI